MSDLHAATSQLSNAIRFQPHVNEVRKAVEAFAKAVREDTIAEVRELLGDCFVMDDGRIGLP